MCAVKFAWHAANMAAESREKRANDLGPTGKRVAANVARLRGSQPSTYELSRLLGEMGRPVSASGITKVEAGQRRVDADDLVALALALDVTPNDLLLPPEGDVEAVLLAPTKRVTNRDAWHWATSFPEAAEPSAADMLSYGDKLSQVVTLLAEIEADGGPHLRQLQFALETSIVAKAKQIRRGARK